MSSEDKALGRAQSNYARIMRTVADESKSAPQRLADIGDLFGFLTSKGGAGDRLPHADLATMSKALVELRAAALAEDEWVRDDSCWGYTEMALERIAEITGQPLSAGSPKLSGIALLQQGAAILADDAMSWAERFRKIQATPELCEIRALEDAIQGDCDANDAPEVLEVMRALREAFGDHNPHELTDHWWGYTVHAMLGGWYNDMRGAGLFDAFDAEEQAAATAFIEYAQSDLSSTAKPVGGA